MGRRMKRRLHLEKCASPSQPYRRRLLWGIHLICRNFRRHGLPDSAVKESKYRVSTALTNSGFKFPMGRTTINVARADVKKEGPSFDLPIAMGMIAASDQLETDQLENF